MSVLVGGGGRCEVVCLGLHVVFLFLFVVCCDYFCLKFKIDPTPVASINV